MLVKICGIGDIESAQVAVKAGADFLGFIFVPNTRRYIEPVLAKKVIEAIKGKVKVVGVFRDQPVDEVNGLVKSLELDLVQLHGNESPNYVKEIICDVIKAFNLPSNFNVSQVQKLVLQYQVKYILVDREKTGEGEKLDLGKIGQVSQISPILLSGGLDPENLELILGKVSPMGVDVSSGVESDGKKDLEKIRSFIKFAKGKTKNDT